MGSWTWTASATPAASAATPANAARRDPLRLWGANVALFERAADALPARPTLHMALDHPGLSTILGRVALRYDYDLA